MKLLSITLAFILAAVAPVLAKTFETSAGRVEVTQVAGPFERPWALAFLPGGGMLVTERPGRLLFIGADGSVRPVAGVPESRQMGQGGMLDVAVAPDFETTREIYLTFTEPDGLFSGRTALARGRFEIVGSQPALRDVQVVFRLSESSRAGVHFGSRIVFAEDGQTLWMTVGDRGDRERAQDLSVHNGKVLRLNRDGSIPQDNPFVGRPGVRPEIWSYGHRNPQGATRRSDGALITVSHGARGGDEVNQSKAGLNYGWPIISYGRHYSGLKIGLGFEADGMEQPLWFWDPSIAPSGASFVNKGVFAGWTESLFVGALKGSHIARLETDGDGYRVVERLFEDEFGRIRDVREGPNGALWFLTDAGQGGLYRVLPAR